MPGVYCAQAQGAIYHFPRIELPEGAVEAAREADEAPDVWYYKKLLESTGVCVVLEGDSAWVMGCRMARFGSEFHFWMTRRSEWRLW